MPFSHQGELQGYDYVLWLREHEYTSFANNEYPSQNFPAYEEALPMICPKKQAVFLTLLANPQGSGRLISAISSLILLRKRPRFINDFALNSLQPTFPHMSGPSFVGDGPKAAKNLASWLFSGRYAAEKGAGR